METKEISQAVIGRLPRYFRYLGDLRDDNVERISSQELSELMQVTASQIRQDFNNFGGFGQQDPWSGSHPQSDYRRCWQPWAGVGQLYEFCKKRFPVCGNL